MNLNHSVETCHLSQVIDGSLVFIDIVGQIYLAFKGFEMLSDDERSDLIIILNPSHRPDRSDRGPILKRVDEDWICLDLGKSFVLDLIPALGEVEITTVDETPAFGSIWVVGDKICLPTVVEDEARGILDLDDGELLTDITHRDVSVIKHWRIGISTHGAGGDSICWLLDSLKDWM